MAELIDGSLVTGPPKSAAGRRLVSIPAAILPDVATHLDRYTLPALCNAWQQGGEETGNGWRTDARPSKHIANA